MTRPARIQDADIVFPRLKQIRGLYIFISRGVNKWGQPLTPKQARHIISLLSPQEARQLTVTLRPDVEQEVAFDRFEIFSLHRSSSTVPHDPDLAILYQHPLVDYHPTNPSLAICLARIFQAARHA